MKAIDILKNNENLFLIEGISGKAKSLSQEINNLFAKINEKLKSIESFKSEQAEGDYNKKIYMAKSLDRFFGPNKFLKLETVIANYDNEEKAIIDNFYSLKANLLNALNSLIRESNKNAVVCKYDLFDGDLVLCPENHEILILGGRNAEILNTVKNSLDEDLNATGNFENVHARNLDYDKSTIVSNINLCNQRANSLLSSKQDRLTEIVTSISRLKEISHRVVAFYTFKHDLLFVGCQPKGVKAYEKTLLKEYKPLKKEIQKALKIELEDICEENEEENDYTMSAEDKIAHAREIYNKENTPSLESAKEENVANLFSTEPSSNETPSNEIVQAKPSPTDTIEDAHTNTEAIEDKTITEENIPADTTAEEKPKSKNKPAPKTDISKLNNLMKNFKKD